MKIVWQFDSDDIDKVKAFFNEHANNSFVKSRISTNLRADKPPITKDEFWEKMVGCLLTTQQRSRPGAGEIKFFHGDRSGFAAEKPKA